MKLEISGTEQGEEDTSHDRLSVLRDAHRTLIALADGVDASRAAQSAAARAVDELAKCFRAGSLPDDPRDWAAILETIDREVLSDSRASETSALVILVQQGVVLGASVGDSLAYIVAEDGKPRLLSGGQRRGPRIGTGMASPVAFGPAELDGRLITRRAMRTRKRGLFRTALAETLGVPSKLAAG